LFVFFEKTPKVRSVILKNIYSSSLTKTESTGKKIFTVTIFRLQQGIKYQAVINLITKL